jgi:transglutaminase-like putative cysteine protease
VALLEGRERNQQLMLAQLLVGVMAGLAEIFRSPLAWIFLLPCGISFFRRIERAPAWLESGARYAAWTLVFLAAGMVRFFPTAQIFSVRTTLQLEEFVGYSLLALAVLFLSGPKIWRPGLTLFPAAIAALALVAIHAASHMTVALIVASPAAFFYLAITAVARPDASSGTRYGSRQVLRVGGAAVFVFLTAVFIIRTLPWAQVQIEQAAFKFFSIGVTQYSSLSLESRLGDIEQLLQSSRLVMRVYSSQAQKLRGRVFTSFDGAAWHGRLALGRHVPTTLAAGVADPELRDWLEEIPGESYAIPPHNPEQAAAPGAIRTRIVQSLFNEGLLVAPGGKLLVRAQVSSLRLDPFEGLATPLSSDVEIYGIVNRREGDVAQPGDAVPETLAESLALPDDTDARFRELAARLTADAPTAAERVRRTVEYVKGAALYSLRVGKFRSAQPVAEFLFEKKQGYCEFFASAAAILLRLEGVPARYVTGFEVEEGNREGGHYVVRELDAHAWIEAYVPGRGWVEADPTPEAEYDTLHAEARPNWASSVREWTAAQWAEISIRVRAGDWSAASRWVWDQMKVAAHVISWGEFFAGLVIAVILGGAIRIALRARRWRPGRRAIDRERAADSGVAPALVELLARVDSAWARAGFRRPSTSAPLEHLTRIAQEKLAPALRDASRRAVECYYGARYAGIATAEAEIHAVQKDLDRAAASPLR